MKPSAYWITGTVVCGVLAAVVIAAKNAGPAPRREPVPATVMPGESFSKKTEDGVVIVEKLERSEEEWKKLLTPKQYHILREKGTERPFTGDLLNNKDAGVYKCAGCGLALFRSDGKFDSGCGWPSFFEPLEGAHITETIDKSLGMVRTEITCSRCGGHLGHVFTDGPAPTGLRYCVNSVSIEFDKDDGEAKKPDAEPEGK